MSNNIIRMHPQNETEEILKFALSRLGDRELMDVSEKFGIDTSEFRSARRFRWYVRTVSFAVGAVIVVAYIVFVAWR